MRILMLLLLMLPCTLGWCQDYVQDFEQGLGGAASYHPAPDDLKIEHVTENANHFARVTLPGKKRLEGFYISATGLTGARLATVTGQVRGKGEVWLCLISGNGWLYSPQTRKLTDQWQEVSLSKVLVAKDKSLGIYFITQNERPGAVYEVDSVKVTLGLAPQVFDAEVGPWRLEAEDYAQRASTVKAEAEAEIVSNERYVALNGLPFPRTSKPVSLYARVQPEHAKDEYRVATTLGGNTQYLQTLPAPKLGEWQWLRFAPLVPGEVGDSFNFVCTRDQQAAGEAAVDALVMSTQADLTDEQLAAAPGLFGTRPAAAVAPAAAAPVIDGKLDDPAWQQAVTCSGFTLMGSTILAQADTQVRVTHDDTNLYLAFLCPEPLLDTAQQRRHEFLAKLTQRDAEVYEDDCVVALVQPPGSERVYDFTVNALGTIADAVDDPPDLWEKRDVKWNSQARAQGLIEERQWSVELAIPFADLGVKPQAGQAWRVSLGRIARGRKETSSWNLSDKGFHDPVELGALVFAGTAAGVRPEAPATLQPVANELTVHQTSPAPLYLLTELHSARGSRRVYDFVAGDTPGAATQRFDVTEEGEVRLAHAVLEAGSLRPLYVTPLVPRTPKSSFATLKLAAAGPYELFLNDEPVAQGASADAAEIKLPLQKGPNVIAIKLAQGTAALKLEAPGRVDGGGWKIAAADSQKPGARLLDDSALPPAPQVGDQIGEAGKPVVLRRTLLWENTRVWPTPEPALFLARGSAQHVTLLVEGLKHRKLPGWATYVATPPEFEVTGATGFYGVQPTQKVWSTQDLGEQQIGDRTMRVTKIMADKPVATVSHPIMSQLEVFVRYREQAGEPKQTETSFVYWSEAADGSVVEPAQSFRVRLLPPLRGAQCKTYVWQLWGGWLSNMDDLERREEVLECSQAAGFNDIVGGDRWTSDNGSRYGLKHTLGTNFRPWTINLEPYLKEHPDERLLRHDGKPDDGLMCMTLLLGDGWQAAEAQLQAKLDQIRPHVLDYDFEYGPFAGPHSCYCPRCLQAFREHAKLAADTALDPEIIKQQYSAQWMDFMCLRVAQMFVRFKETVHRLSPGTLFSTYSGYQTEDNPERYGIDWRYLGKLQAVDRAGCGYGRPVEALKATIEALQGIPLLGGALVVPYETAITNPQTPLNKAWLLRVLLDSTGGVLVYDRLTLDGRSWYAMAETTRLVAEYEEVFLKGKHSALAGVDPANGEVVTDGKTTLVCLMNPTGKTVTYKVTLPREAGAAKEYYSGKAAKAGEAVEVSLEAGESAVYVLAK